jgi:hypothetical protein
MNYPAGAQDMMTAQGKEYGPCYLGAFFREEAVWGL